jgi:hypothetical protein
MADVFLRQEEAMNYAAAIEGPERVWVEFVLSLAIGQLMRDPNYVAGYTKTPFDLLLLAKIAHASVRDRELVKVLLSGEYSRFADVPDLF